MPFVEQFHASRATCQSDGIQRRQPDRYPSLVCQRRDPQDPQDPVAGRSSPDLRAFHRYLYKPFKAGAFRKGADGRIKAIIKAALASAAILKLLSNAEKNAEADPALCKFVPTIGNVKAGLSSLASKIRGGSATSGDADSTSSLFDQLKNGTGFTSPPASSLPGLG